MQTFKAYRTFEQDKVVSSRFVNLSLDDLDKVVCGSDSHPPREGDYSEGYPSGEGG